MPLSLRVDAAARTVWARAWGSLSRADVVGGLHVMAEDSRFGPGFAQVFDLREVVELEITTGELRGIASLAAGLTDRLGAGRLALVSDRPAIFGMCRMYEVFSESLPVDVRVFRDFDEAVSWIRSGV
jgi:hypothetical protein